VQVIIKNLTNDASVIAEVSDSRFFAINIPLEVGANEIFVSATDSLGNVRSKSVLVSRIAVGSRRLSMLGGNRQTGSLQLTGFFLPKQNAMPLF
jgi:hypothetical protein